MGGQFLPPQKDGQNSARLPVPGFRAGSTSGPPGLRSTLRKTFCFTNGLASTKLMRPLVRSRNHMLRRRQMSMRPLMVPVATFEVDEDGWRHLVPVPRLVRSCW